MDAKLFEKVDSLLDEIAGEVGRLLEAPETAKLRELLVRLDGLVRGKYSTNLDVRVDLTDDAREKTMTLLSMGLGFGEDGPYPTTGDSSPARYIVDGEIAVVPHDYCPKCWGHWDFKLPGTLGIQIESTTQCPECGAQLGKNVKVLLDSDVCPNCEKGKISMKEPKCNRCGFEVNPNHVAWG